MMKRKSLFVIWLIAIFLSYGFIMEFQWPWLAKKETAKKSTPKQEASQTEAKSKPAPIQTVPAKQTEEKQSQKAISPRMSINEFFKKKEGQGGAPKEKSTKKPVSSNITSREKAPELPQQGLPGASPTSDEVGKLQKELQVIAEQTKRIEVQNQADRVRLQKIIEQTKIQQRIVKTLQVPKPVTSKTIANPEEVLRATKVRLIADDVKRTQTAIRNMQITKTSAVQISKVPKKVAS